MDATHGIQLMSLIKPGVTMYVFLSMRKETITDRGDHRPIHYDDYDVFMSPLEDFKKAVSSAGWDDRVVYLDRADQYRFTVKG